jgi:hypothetical protein
MRRAKEKVDTLMQGCRTSWLDPGQERLKIGQALQVAEQGRRPIGDMVADAEDLYRIVLSKADVREARCHGCCERQLAIRSGDAHRSARVEQDVQRGLALGTVRLDHHLIEPAVRVPIEMTQVVTGSVGFVIRDLEPARLRTEPCQRVAGFVAQAVAGREAKAPQLA